MTPRRTGFRVSMNVPIPLRDGTLTYADVYRPAGTGRHPVILERTPYGKGEVQYGLTQIDLLRAMARGYAVVVQDCRGRFTSRGEFHPFVQETDDGYDSIEWCAAQRWADGNVGMIGQSYVGATQLLAATAKPPHLRCVVPCVTSSDYYEGWTYQGGALQWGFVSTWALSLAAEALVNGRGRVGDRPAARARLVRMADHPCSAWSTLPLRELPIVAELAPYFLEWLDHPSRDEYWRRISISERHEEIRVPALNVSGWYDIFRDGTLGNFAGLRARGGSAEARTGTRLLMGPWEHEAPGHQKVGIVNFGMEAGHGPNPLNFDQYSAYFDFFDRWLMGESRPRLSDPPVRLYVMGEGWRDESEWPLARTRHEHLFLRSTGRAGTVAGDGRLSTKEPVGERPDSFVYDPSRPVPTRGGQNCCQLPDLPAGPFDQSEIERRDDVLVYDTEPLKTDLEVTGPVVLRLWAATNGPDTDFTAKLVDVSSDGMALNLTDGIIRGRYRETTALPTLLTPGLPTEFSIAVGSTSRVFRAGHRIRLEVSSSNFPRFDRNHNTEEDFSRDVTLRPAHQTIFHDVDRPSHLVLPVIPR